MTPLIYFKISAILSDNVIARIRLFLTMKSLPSFKVRISLNITLFHVDINERDVQVGMRVQITYSTIFSRNKLNRNS